MPNTSRNNTRTDTNACGRRLLSVLLAASLMLTLLCTAGMRARAEGGSEPKMTDPTYIFDFTDESTFTLGLGAACSTELTDDGLKATVIGDDPQFPIGAIFENSAQCDWIVVKFRGEAASDKRTGELYFATEDAEYSEKTRVYLKWGAVTQEWQTLIMHSRMLERLDAELTSVRFDPYTNAGGEAELVIDEWLEVAYIAFFSEEADARAFDYDEYIKTTPVTPAPRPTGTADGGETWTGPAAAERWVLSADNAPGTLTISSDGASLTVTQGEGEARKSVVVPDNAYFRNGPLAGIDDLGKALPDQHTVIDPDYVVHDEDGNAAVFDAAARTVGVYGQNGTRYVGIFYFLWHGTMPDITDTPRNIQEMLDRYGTAIKDMPELWGVPRTTFYFAKPLYGYYRSEDEWVIRRHMELLINAGVDFLYFDTTNNYLYERTAIKIMQICHELNEQGFAAPKVVFYTHTDAEQRVRQAYNTIYSKNVYPDTWFMLDGKPLIIAPLQANINRFFTIRVPQWPNEDMRTDSWPWIDFDWPQQTYGRDFSEAINASVAQHNGNIQFSSSELYGYRGNRGRSYDGYADAPEAGSYKQGTNFALQLNRAIDSGAPYVLVTGWNEWIANRMDPPLSEEYPICFMDTFDLEYSRDVEMSEGGYFDNYYMQLAAGIASIRGAAPEFVRDDRHAIDVAGDFAQWDQVAHYYTDPAGDAAWRDAAGVGALKYKNETGRNDIVRIKVTGDTSYLYFYAECAEDIKHGSGSDSWMQLLLNVDNAATGWLGYDYIACFKTKSDSVATLARAAGSGYGFTEIADITYQVRGNKLMLAIPLEALGLKYFNKISLSFKWIDSRSLINTAEQLYTDGDCAPLGRPDFTYRTYAADAEPEKLLKTVAVAERKAAYDKEQQGLDPIGYDYNKGVVPGWVVPAAIAGGAAVAAAAAAGVTAAVVKKRKKAGGQK